MQRLSKSRWIIGLLLHVAFFAVVTKTFAVETEPSPCSLQARVFDADGNEYNDRTPGIEIYVFLWQKIGDGDYVRGTNGNPVVHSPDGSSWKRIGASYLRDPGWTSEWPVKHDVSPGEYRFSFIVHKIFTTWEGPPGTRESGSGANHGRVTDVNGYGAPKRIFGWGLSDVILVEPGESEKVMNLRPDAGPKVRIRTTFFPDPAAVSATISQEEKEVLPQRYREASEITMRIFRDDNFSTDRYLESGSYGIPWYVDFDRMKPGRYFVHFFRGVTPTETGTTAATDVFSFDVTESGPNDFVFTPKKSLAENAPWQVVGTVRDENGRPLPKVSVAIVESRLASGFSFHPACEQFSTATDDEGKYRLAVNPAPSQSGAIFDAKTNQWRWGFRVQQALIGATRGYQDLGNKSISSRRGDLIFLGELATDELKKELVDRKEEKILVSMNEPVTVDFTLPPQEPEIPWRELNTNPERRKRRLEILESRKRSNDSDAKKLFREIVLPNSLNGRFVEAMEVGARISTTLTTEKPTFMLNEPIELSWNIANGNNVDVSVMLDENMGDPTEVWAVSAAGDVIMDKEQLVVMHSGPIYFERLLPKKSFSYKIFLPDKFAISKPGRYTINVVRNLSVQRIEPAKDERSRRWFGESTSWESVSVPVSASVTIDVVPTDPVALGKQINELVRVIQGRDKTKKYDDAEKALQVLCAIDDERAVPCLVGEIREDNYSFAYHSLGALSKFKSDAALKGIKKAFKFSDHNLLLSAAYAMAAGKHPNAVAELLENQNHSNYSVRLIVVQSADKMDHETALEMLRNHFDDDGGEGVVGREARRIYDELTAPKTKQ